MTNWVIWTIDTWHTGLIELVSFFSSPKVCEPIGLILGPICILFLSKIDFHITRYVHVDKYTSSGELDLCLGVNLNKYQSNKKTNTNAPKTV